MTTAPRAGGFAILLFIVTLTSVVFTRPIFRVPWWDSHERGHYPARFCEFIAGHDAGYVYARWCPDFAAGKGTPFFDFYPPGYFLVALAFHKTSGLDTLLSMKLAVVFLTLVAGLGVACLALELTGGNFAAAAAASVVYIYTPYRCTDLYIRGDLAEYAALACLPFVFLGLERIVSRTDQDKSAAGSTALAALAYFATTATHAISGVLCGYVGAVFLACRAVRVPRAKIARAVLWGSAAFAVGILMAGFWAVPATLNQKHVQISRVTMGRYDIRKTGARPMSVLDPRTWGSNLRNYATGEDRDRRRLGMCFSLGLPFAIALAIALTRAVPFRRLSRIAAQAAERVLPGEDRLDRLRLWTWLTIAMIPLTFQGAGLWFIWHIPFARYAQFPWRLLMLVTLGASAVVALVIHHAAPRRAAAGWLLAAGFALVALVTASHLRRIDRPLEREKLALTRQEIAATVSTFTIMDEYLPRGIEMDRVSKDRSPGAWILLAGEADIALASSGYANYEFVVNARTDGRLLIDQFFYPGWVARRRGNETARLNVTANEKRLIVIEIPAGSYALLVRWEGSWTHRLGWFASLLGAVCLVGLFIVAVRNRSRPDRGEAGGILA